MVLMLLAACTSDKTTEEPTDKWNGYFERLKEGEVIHTLWAGKNIDVGTVTYGIDNNANFYVTYDCSASGWMISETHMFAGDKADLPRNKPGKPKIGHFPNSTDHEPWVSTFNYYVPLSSLPAAEEPGFVVASHAVVHSPAGGNETAWAEGSHEFHDKGWGWYDDYYFNQDDNPGIILYALEFDIDSLSLWMINMSTESAESSCIHTEYIEGASGHYDGCAYDPETSTFLFTDRNSSELYANNLNDTSGSYSLGVLTGSVKSADFYNNTFYYVDAGDNTLHAVTFTPDWQLENDIITGNIPGSVDISDLAMSPDGDYMYFVGEVGDGSAELITRDNSSDTYSTINLSVDGGTQIAFGSDSELYAIEPYGINQAQAYIINLNTGVCNPIESDPVIIIDDPFTDISKGPVM